MWCKMKGLVIRVVGWVFSSGGSGSNGVTRQGEASTSTTSSAQPIPIKHSPQCNGNGTCQCSRTEEFYEENASPWDLQEEIMKNKPEFPAKGSTGEPTRTIYKMVRVVDDWEAIDYSKMYNGNDMPGTSSPITPQWSLEQEQELREAEMLAHRLNPTARHRFRQLHHFRVEEQKLALKLTKKDFKVPKSDSEDEDEDSIH